ncbi:MAG TPA: hypothetical protein P5056_01430 [Candidatus Paceibacterota bacterium]|nr:hypothetical protein [Candidatus Paceibacterota bacterium]
MNKLFAKLNIFSPLRKFFDKDPEKVEPSPRFGWVLILILFLMFSLAFMVLYYFMFLPQSDEALSGKPAFDPELSIENISKPKLQKTLEPWIAREKQFNDYLNNRPSFDFLK